MNAADELRRAAARALPLVDLTSLNDDDDAARIAAVCGRAVTPRGRVAAVCVWPHFVAQARAALTGSGVGVAAVANFPAGDDDLDGAVADTRVIVGGGGDEVDVVMPYRAWLDGRPHAVTRLVEACRAACGDRTLKVILETGRLRGPDDVTAAGRAAILAGADFIKSSTGRIDVSATPEAVEAMLRAVAESGRPVGVKASGDIRTTEQAAQYLAQADRIMGPGWASPGTFRFGASGLLDALLATLER